MDFIENTPDKDKERKVFRTKKQNPFKSKRRVFDMNPATQVVPSKKVYDRNEFKKGVDYETEE